MRVAYRSVGPVMLLVLALSIAACASGGAAPAGSRALVDAGPRAMPPDARSGPGEDATSPVPMPPVPPVDPHALPDDVAASMDIVEESFDVDPGWEGRANRLGRSCLDVRQDFGFARGEIGGVVSRSVFPSTYGLPFEPRGLEGRLAFDGEIRLASGDGEAYIGFYSSRVSGWRPANFIGLRLDADAGDSGIEASYTTGTFESGGAFAPFRLPVDGASHHFVIEYLPDEGANGAIFLRLDGAELRVDLADGARSSPFTVDRLGIVNVQKPGGQSLEVYLDGLYFNVTNQHFDFDEDPGWDGQRNRGTFEDCKQRGVQDYGWSSTSFAGGADGEIGGLIWRFQNTDPPSLYADASTDASIDDPLFASGVVSMERGAVDSGVFLGWFAFDDGFSTFEAPASFIGIGIEGPSRIGHYFNATMFDASGGRHREYGGPVLVPDGADHRFTVLYRPDTGTLRVALGGVVQEVPVPPEVRADMHRFNRFGITPWRPDGQSLEIYFDDLRYTRARR